MAGIAYVDSSALLKLAFDEAETAALEADVSERDGLVSSRLTAIECGRALGREPTRQARYALEQLLESVFLVDISAEIVERAVNIAPPALRSLDAIQLVTALAATDPSLAVITYDQRLADAARAHGLTVVQPGL